MQCTSCRLESNNLRPYMHAHAAAGAPVLLCPACRVLNSLHPRYVAADIAQFDLAGTGAMPAPTADRSGAGAAGR